MTAWILQDSRRLTGPNLVSDRPGAVIQASLPRKREEEALNLWRHHVRAILDTVGWHGEICAVRQWPGGADLVITAPLDALYAATEVNEWAFEATRAALAGEQVPALAEAGQRLRQVIEAERNPRLMELCRAAGKSGLSVLVDDDHVSLGTGCGSATFACGQLPAVADLDWTQFGDIPVALVTGTNGKSTTVRLLQAIAEAAGIVAGVCSTDWIRVGDELIDTGDYSGPGGARTILREKRAQIAFLETARGGLLRRGLGYCGAAAALVTNVAEDHLGEYGVNDLTTLAQTKLLVAKGLRPDGVLVVNAEDERLVAIAGDLPHRRFWFSTGGQPEGLPVEDDLAFVRDGVLVMRRDGRFQEIVAVDQVPIALGGAARHNLANALAAAAVAVSLGIEPVAVGAGLRAFKSDPASNPGRSNLYHIGGVTILVDFAHNPHGMDALVGMAIALPAHRRLILLGQAGDRDDASIRALARKAWRARPDRIILKEMSAHLRGRQPFEIPRLMAAELASAGAPDNRVLTVSSEMEAVRSALAWARPNDLLLLLMHADRAPVFQLLETLQRQQWQPGEALPIEETNTEPAHGSGPEQKSAS